MNTNVWTKTYKTFNQFNIYRKTFNIYRKVTATCEITSVVLDGSPCCELFTQVHSDLSLWGKGRGPLSDSLALGPGKDTDISERLPGEPLSPLIHTQTRGPSTCPTPAMSPCLLGCVVFCLLQAGESWGAGSPWGCQH